MSREANDRSQIPTKTTWKDGGDSDEGTKFMDSFMDFIKWKAGPNESPGKGMIKLVEAGPGKFDVIVEAYLQAYPGRVIPFTATLLRMAVNDYIQYAKSLEDKAKKFTPLCQSCDLGDHSRHQADTTLGIQLCKCPKCTDG